MQALLRRDLAVTVWVLAIFAVALAVALIGRMVGVDQSYVMLLAQEFLLGRAQYIQIYDLQPAAAFYIHLPAIVMFRLSGLPVMAGWNIYLVALSALSAYLLASRLELKSRVPVMLIWFACMALGFDDHLFGQRDFFLAVAWYPYVAARLSRPAGYVRPSDIVLGLLLSLVVCAKPPFALFVVLIDLPILFFCGRRQSIAPLATFVVGCVIQVAQFFLFEPVSQYFALAEKINYYSTVGYALYPSLVAFFGTTEIYVMLAVVIVMLVTNPRKSAANWFVLACGLTGLISFVVGILQGHPRNYYFIPVVLSAVAAPLCSLFYRFDEPTEGAPYIRPAVPLHVVQTVALLAAILQLLFMEGGAGRALVKKYIWGYPDSARIGQSVKDEYMDWVQQHVPKDEEISVIALQYGTTSAWDPLLSTLRLGRRVNSYAPIIQFPLRAALVSGDKSRIDEAWKTVMEEITTAKADWVIIRNTAPEPLEPDFMNLVRKTPLFYDWLLTHYPIQAQFGPYFAFRHPKDK